MISLLALSMRVFDSYDLVMNGGASCAIGWGTENRNLPVCKIGNR
jgi:hypothetical protein